MSAPFDEGYSEAYDALYEEKDYAKECDLIDRIFREDSPGEVRRVLDLGCGTGGHAWELARRGYRVVGVDRSAPMLAQALAKAPSSGVTSSGAPRFVLGDLRELDLVVEGEEPFDAAIMMFAVLGYLTQDADVLAALGEVRRRVKAGSVFVFDCWYGPAVVAEGPSERTKHLEMGEEHLERTAVGRLDSNRDVCTVAYHLVRSSGDKVLSDVREDHQMRYFFLPGLETLLVSSGFELIRTGQFPHIDRAPDEASWNIVGVARAAGAGPGR